MKVIQIIFFCIISSVVYSQNAVVIENHQERKPPETTWGANNKHFGHYQFRYLVVLPFFNSSNIEKSLLSGCLSFGYQYRYRLVKMFDIGTELTWENNYSTIVDDSVHLFVNSGSFNKLRTFQNGIRSSAFGRFVISDNTIRNLGWHIDIGAYGSYYPFYGIFMQSNNSQYKNRLREKQPNYLTYYDYGIFMRAGKNNLNFYTNFSLAGWIKNLQSIDYRRGTVRIGIQINLYAK
jgi:hypothetical protein